MLLWSLVWSWTDGHWNFWPLVYLFVFYWFVFFMAWLMRNNP